MKKTNIIILILITLWNMSAIAQIKSDAIAYNLSKMHSKNSASTFVQDGSLSSIESEIDTAKSTDKPAEPFKPFGTGALLLIGDPGNGVWLWASGYYNLTPNIAITTAISAYAFMGNAAVSIAALNSPTATYVSVVPMLESDFGINFTLLDGGLTINPSVGFCHGSFTNGTYNFIAFESFVPSLIVFGKKDWFEMEGDFYMYLNIIKGSSTAVPSNILWTWAYPGFTATSFFTFGPHWELQHNVTTNTPTYHWLGAWARFNFNDRFNIRVAGGYDFTKAASVPSTYSFAGYFRVVLGLTF